MQSLDLHPPEWHEARLEGIGGSDWTDIMSMPNGCARRLWYEKRRTVPDFTPIVTGQMLRGSMTESVVDEVFRMREGATTYEDDEDPDMRPPGLPEWWIGNIDRTVVNEGPYDYREGLGVAEFKTKNEWALKMVKRDGVPHDEILQVQHYMTRKARLWAPYYALECDDYNRYHLEVFDHSPILEAQMIIAGNRFWRMVENGPKPERLEIDDSRCSACEFRITCQGDRIELLTNVPEGDYVQHDDIRVDRLITEHLELNRLAKDVKDLKDAKKEEIRDITGEGQWCGVSGVKVSVGMTAKRKFNRKRLASDHPDIDQESYMDTGTPYHDVRVYGKGK